MIFAAHPSVYGSPYSIIDLRQYKARQKLIKLVSKNLSQIKTETKTFKIYSPEYAIRARYNASFDKSCIYIVSAQWNSNHENELKGIILFFKMLNSLFTNVVEIILVQFNLHAWYQIQCNIPWHWLILSLNS